jgi:hypothetical protein
VSIRNAPINWAILAIALFVVNVSLTFANVWPTFLVRPAWAVSLEAAACVLALAVAAGRGTPASKGALRAIAIGWVLLVVGRYAAITTRSLYGRDINLYWDLRNIPDVGAMLAFVARPLFLAAAIGAIVLVPLLVYAPIRWALGRIAAACTDRRGRLVLTTIASAAVLAAAIEAATGLEHLPRFAEPMTAVYGEQAWKLASEFRGASRRIVPPAPSLASNLARVEGADVFVIFIESYGAVSWDRPEFARTLADRRARFASDIRETNRRVVSAYVGSPTFGGKSWLAHISLLSGTQVRDEDTNEALMREPRETLVKAFGRRGYRTVAVMPGLQHAWPEGAFYGFDEVYGADRLAYQGPPFGWWDMTDQFVLARMDATFVEPRPRAPVFAFLPTISTHAPFTPTPPYEPDWRRVLTPDPYPDDKVERAYNDAPDWMDLGPGYVKALRYAFETIGGYLRLRADRDFVMVLIGDHQPPAAVSGVNASWEVPVHVIASRPTLLDELVKRGFREGLTPSHPQLGTVADLTPMLLRAFGD